MLQDLFDSDMTDPVTGESYDFSIVPGSERRMLGCNVERREYTIGGQRQVFEVTMYDEVEDGMPRVQFKPVGSAAPDTFAAAAPAPAPARAVGGQKRKAATPPTPEQAARVANGDTLTVVYRGKEITISPEVGIDAPHTVDRVLRDVFDAQVIYRATGRTKPLGSNKNSDIALRVLLRQHNDAPKLGMPFDASPFQVLYLKSGLKEDVSDEFIEQAQQWAETQRKLKEEYDGIAKHFLKYFGQVLPGGLRTAFCVGLQFYTKDAVYTIRKYRQGARPTAAFCKQDTADARVKRSKILLADSESQMRNDCRTVALSDGALNVLRAARQTFKSNTTYKVLVGPQEFQDLTRRSQPPKRKREFCGAAAASDAGTDDGTDGGTDDEEDELAGKRSRRDLAPLMMGLFVVDSETHTLQLVGELNLDDVRQGDGVAVLLKQHERIWRREVTGKGVVNGGSIKFTNSEIDTFTEAMTNDMERGFEKQLVKFEKDTEIYCSRVPVTFSEQEIEMWRAHLEGQGHTFSVLSQKLMCVLNEWVRAKMMVEGAEQIWGIADTADAQRQQQGFVTLMDIVEKVAKACSTGESRTQRMTLVGAETLVVEIGGMEAKHFTLALKDVYEHMMNELHEQIDWRYADAMKVLVKRQAADILLATYSSQNEPIAVAWQDPAFMAAMDDHHRAAEGNGEGDGDAAGAQPPASEDMWGEMGEERQARYAGTVDIPDRLELTKRLCREMYDFELNDGQAMALAADLSGPASELAEQIMEQQMAAARAEAQADALRRAREALSAASRRPPSQRRRKPRFTYAQEQEQQQADEAAALDAKRAAARK